MYQPPETETEKKRRRRSNLKIKFAYLKLRLPQDNYMVPKTVITDKMTDFAHLNYQPFMNLVVLSNKWMSTTPDPNFAPLTRLFPTTKHTTSMIKINKNNHQPVILPFQEPAFGIGNSPTTIDFPRRFSSFSSFTLLPEYIHVPKKNQNKKIKNAKEKPPQTKK